jgi:prepilin signal peptidase PulO-like enzyme (type II secretory pathway)
MLIASPNVSHFSNILHFVRDYLSQAAPGMPPETWWMVAMVLFVLGVAAAIDTIAAVVPDPLIFFGLVAVIAAQGIYSSWPYAARNLGWALGTALVIWCFNELWHLALKRDAVGMGDAKWTMLAVACFGLIPSLMAWGIGACIGILWMGIMYVARRPIGHVHFAPFLFVGLITGIWWLRLRG